MNAQLGMFFESVAVFSPCRTWRYTLHRQWGDGPAVVFLMFNPSTADEAHDDATIRKCRGFAVRWGYKRMTIVNLFAIRGTDPRTPSRAADPVGPENDAHILTQAGIAGKFVCAWGCSAHMKGKLAGRPAEVLSMLKREYPDLAVECLGYSKDGSPRHPLMLAYETKSEPFEVKL